jgi:hypothetical protein
LRKQNRQITLNEADGKWPDIGGAAGILGREPGSVGAGDVDAVGDGKGGGDGGVGGGGGVEGDSSVVEDGGVEGVGDDGVEDGCGDFSDGDFGDGDSDLQGEVGENAGGKTIKCEF